MILLQASVGHQTSAQEVDVVGDTSKLCVSKLQGKAVKKVRNNGEYSQTRKLPFYAPFCKILLEHQNSFRGVSFLRVFRL